MHQALLWGFLLVHQWVDAAYTQARFSVPKIDLPREVMNSWAQYSPAFPVDSYEVPQGCTITQVNILQRHGARFPTKSAGERIQVAVAKLKQAMKSLDPHLRFLKTYTYDLGTDDLIGFGAAQARESGKEAFGRYSQLLSTQNPPFIRTSSSSRVVASATNWSAGLTEASLGTIIPSPPLILNDAANDTLNDKMCKNSGNADVQTSVWTYTFAPPIVERLNTAAPGANLSPSDIPNLISLCAFDTLAKEKPSPWCHIFTQEDFEDFEYFGDLKTYYNTGYGQPLGPVQGVGYVNELLARLTGTPVSDATQTNRTLDSSPITFPLNRTLYVDFSHDNQMIAILSAMGLMRPAIALDPLIPDPSRTWLASHLVPFSGKIVTERLLCNERVSVRVLINDAVAPMEMCGAGENGICDLDAFVKSQAYARHNGKGDWEKCFSHTRF